MNTLANRPPVVNCVRTSLRKIAIDSLVFGKQNEQTELILAHGYRLGLPWETNNRLATRMRMAGEETPHREFPEICRGSGFDGLGHREQLGRSARHGRQDRRRRRARK